MITECTDALLLAELNEEVQHLHHTLYPEVFKPYNKKAITGFFADMLAKEGVYSFVAAENEEALGYVFVYTHTFIENPFQYQRRFLVLDQLLVKEQHRGKEIAKLLLQKVIDLANSEGLTSIELNHWTLNETARRFFNKNGFNYVNERMRREL